MLQFLAGMETWIVFPSAFCVSHLFLGRVINHSRKTSTTKNVCVFPVCTNCQRTPDTAALNVLLNCRCLCPYFHIVSVLSVTILQVIHVHSEQWGHTSSGCLATTTTRTHSTGREAERNLGKELTAWRATFYYRNIKRYKTRNRKSLSVVHRISCTRNLPTGLDGRSNGKIVSILKILLIVDLSFKGIKSGDRRPNCLILAPPLNPSHT